MGTQPTEAAGFFMAASWVPSLSPIGKLPHQDYDLVKVFVPVAIQHATRHPREVQAGDVPSFLGRPSVKIDGDTARGRTGSKTASPVARQFASDGNYEEAVRHYGSFG